MESTTKQLLRKGRRLIESGRASQAVVCLAEAADRSPDNAEVLTHLARAYQQIGKPIRALEVYDLIIEL
jgi:Flp pilus assembly protein TadD